MFFSSGAGFFAHQSENHWSDRRWGHVDHVRPEDEVQSCGGFCSVPGPLQSVQRAEMWGVILALQSSGALHLGVDNLGVVRHVGRLLNGHHGSIPFELVKDGDLLWLIERECFTSEDWTRFRLQRLRHADEGTVLDGRVREVDRLGNDAADEAADFCRRRFGNAVIDARRNLSGVCSRWYPVVLALHRFFIAISRAVVNHDGGSGTAPDPLVWSAGALPKRRRLGHAVRDRAFFRLGHVDGAGQEVHWVRGSGPGRTRIRPNRKTPAHLAGFRVQSRPRVWKRLRLVGYSRVSIPDHKRSRGDQDDRGL